MSPAKTAKPTKPAAGDDYDAASIEVLEGLEAVRKRPGMYIGGTGPQGLAHLLWEIVDNSVDEAAAGHADRIDITLHPDGSAEVSDNGRGIPIGIHNGDITALEVVFTELHAGGKFGQDAYAASGGLHGVGASVVNAMSSRLVADVTRDKAVHRLEFRERIAGNETKAGKFRAGHNLARIGRAPAKRTGTRVQFWPDTGLFLDAEFDYDDVAERARQMCYLVPGVTIAITDQRQAPARTVEAFSRDGLADLVDHLRGDTEPLGVPIVIEGESPYTETVPVDGKLTEIERVCRVDAVLRWTAGYDTAIRTFVNTIPTPDGGTHATGFDRALTASVNTALRQADLRKLRRYRDDKDGRAVRDDIAEGLVAALRVTIPEPQFRGQTKRELGTPQAQKAVTEAVRAALEAWFDGTDKKSKRTHVRTVLDKIADAVITRIETRRAAESRRKAKKLTSSGMPDKLADCRTHPGGELLIVEGDSAAGPAKRARDSQWQAVLPLRGKVVNAAKSTLRGVLDNAEAKALFTAVGAGSGKTFDLQDARYDRIVLLADADVDGSHIRCLVLTLIYHYMQPMLAAGRIYAAQPPTHAVTVKADKQFVYSDRELDKLTRQLDKRNRRYIVTRFKGLGEMDDNELYETTLDPQTRVLRQITLDEAAGEQQTAAEAFGIMMGAPVEPRRDFITEHSAAYGHALDI